MNESQVRKDLIDPALRAAGWECAPAKVVTEQEVSPGRQGQNARKADYVLMVGCRRLAVLEAKREELPAEAGEAQARDYAEALGVRFAYATNGHALLAFELVEGTCQRLALAQLPTPAELLTRLGVKPPTEAPSSAPALLEACAEVPWSQVGERSIRYYQERAVEAVLGAIAQGRDRALLTLATGTGKTFVAYQLLHKLIAVRWSRAGLGKRPPRVLFLAYLNTLANQAADAFKPFGGAAVRLMAGFENVPMDRSCYLTIYQTLLGESGEETRYRLFPPDFFDLVVVDECHHGGSNAQSQWRTILDYFTSAVKLGLTATPVCNANRDTYAYFGEPVYRYSLKQGIEDGFLAPYRVVQLKTDLERYTACEGDTFSDADAVELGRSYSNRELHRRRFAIAEREQIFVEILLDRLPLDEKTILFCEDQAHAADIARRIRETLARRVASGRIAPAVAEAAGLLDPTYCRRVTADDGPEGDAALARFRNNECRLPTLLTTSEKLTTGVDARNLRALVLLREVESEVTFKQILGRGTRLCDGKTFFTLYDFFPDANSNRLFNPAWDGEPLAVCPVCGQAPCICPPAEPRPRASTTPCPKCGCLPCTCPHPALEGVDITLGPGHDRSLQPTEGFYFEGRVQPLEAVYTCLGSRIRSVASPARLKAAWQSEAGCAQILAALAKLGVDEKLLQRIQHLRHAEACDRLDLLLDLAYDQAPCTRQARAAACQAAFTQPHPERARLVELLLGLYVREGEGALSAAAFAATLKQRYLSLAAALSTLGFPSAAAAKAFAEALRRALYA